MHSVTAQTFYLWRPEIRVQVSSLRAILSLCSMEKRMNKGNNASNWFGFKKGNNLPTIAVHSVRERRLAELWKGMV